MVGSTMTDILTPKERSERMSLIRSKDTKVEMVVRRLVHGMGYRYRLHRRDLPGKPDIVLPRHRKIIFIHGCFWHRHQNPDCKIARLPKSNAEYWWPKLEKNRARDEANEHKLQELGWECLTIWECQLGNLCALQETIKAFLAPWAVPDRLNSPLR